MVQYSIKYLRRERHWTQQALADALGVTKLTIGRWERGDQIPEPYHLERLCALFGVSADQLGFTQGRQKHTNDSGALLSAATRTDVFDAMMPLLPTVSLVGRDETITRIKTLLLARQTIAITALNGLPGVGKTTLATVIGHDPDIRARFSDGVLWIPLGPRPDLFGVFNHLGLLLGLSPQHMMTLRNIKDWSDAIRDAIKMRSVLLIIDDAWKLDDMLPFFVVGVRCALLLTTRFPLIASQVATHTTLSVEELSEHESFQLLSQLAPRVVEFDPDRVRQLVQAVGGLPLALTLIGNYLRTMSVSGPSRRIASALEHLSRVEGRFAISMFATPVEPHPSLPHGEHTISLQSILEVTDNHLSAQTRRALYAFSLFPAKPDSFSEEAALAVAACTTATLDELLDTGFLESQGNDRYRLHQIISDYARLHLPPDAEAYSRFFTYVRSFMQSHQKDYELLELESRCILSAINLAEERKEHEIFVELVCAMSSFLLLRGFYQMAEGLLYRAFEVVNNEHARMQIFLLQGSAAQRQSQHKRARELYLRALDIARMHDRKEDLCDVFTHLGSLYWTMGDFADGEQALREALALARQIHDATRASQILRDLGAIVATRGDFMQAKTFFVEGLALARTSGDRAQISILLGNIGTLVSEQGDYQQALIYHQEAVELARQIGDREQMVILMINMGHNCAMQGEYERCESYLREALRLSRELAHDEWISVALSELCVLLTKRGDLQGAQFYAEESLEVISRISRRKVICAVLYACGLLAVELGDLERANDLFDRMQKEMAADDHQTTAMILFGRARVLLGRGQKEEAVRLAQQARSITAANGFLGDQQVIEQWLAEL